MMRLLRDVTLLLAVWAAAGGQMAHTAGAESNGAEANALLRATEAMQNGAFARAVDLYSTAIADDALAPGDRLVAHNNRAVAYRRLGLHRRALDDYDAALALAPADGDLYYNRALALARSGQLDRALRDLDAALKVGAQVAGQVTGQVTGEGEALAGQLRGEVLYNRGNVLQRKGLIESAIADYTRAIELSPTDAQDHYAQDQYTRDQYTQDHYSRAHYARGQAYATLGKHELALADFDRCIELDPRFAPAFSGRGFSLSGTGAHDRAVQSYSVAIDLRPDYAPAYRGRADAFRRLGRFEQAVTDYSRAITLLRDTAEGYYGRGLAYRGLGQYDRAIADFSEAIRRAPDHRSAYSARGTLRFYLGQYSAAARDFRRSLALRPGNAYAALWLFLARQRAGLDGRDELAKNTRGLRASAWPAKIAGLFLGKVPVQEIVAATKLPDSRRQRERESEAFFYIGQYHLLEGDRKLAERFFRRSLLAGITTFVEHAGAETELKKLES